MNTTKIALVDDHPIFLAGLKKLLEEEGGLQVAFTAQSVREAIAQLAEFPVDLVMVDFNMPGKTGIDFLREASVLYPNIPVVMLTVEEDEEIISRAMKEGARGYILKQDSPERLIKSIHSCLAGEILLSDRIYSKVIDLMRKFSPGKEDESELYRILSRREMDIVKSIVQGKSNSDIAETLFISESTVKNHISSILRKLNLKDRVELAIRAVREGIR
ncbi:MAG TPA: response regulator transcription factor [Atribacteraceae bacterium]|nr:response regulator transcription factor [Atribacteraceae bacterium]